MKKTFLVACLSVLCILLLVSCDASSTGATTAESTTTAPDDSVVIAAVAPSVTVKDEQLVDFDYTALFTIIEGGESVSVPVWSIDKNEVETAPGEYIVYCTYGGEQATIIVIVEKTENSLTLSKDSVVLMQKELEEYDFLSLFEAKKDGETVTITEEMITTNLVNAPGIYEYTVTFAGISRTLSITVEPNHWLEAISAYRELPLTVAEAEAYDFASLFTLFVDGMPVRVTSDMVDSSALVNLEVGQSYTVVFSYTYDGTSCTAQTVITIVEEEQLSITAKNIVTYPNGAPIDLTSLFEITFGDAILEVPVRYISGTINYTKEGIYPITLNYPDHAPVVAEVEVKGGVVILAPEAVSIRRGTSLSEYPFENDVVVIVNGVRFVQIPLSCFDLSAVDFSTPGDYPVTLTIRYNKAPLSGLSGVAQYEDVTKTIIYSVSENTYEVSVKNPSLVLGIGTTSYNVFDNLQVKVNGLNQTLTSNPAHVDVISCYAQLLSDPIDFFTVADQVVRVAVYVNGPDQDPIEVTYKLRVEADVTIKSEGACVFVGSPLLVKDLFQITEAGKTVPVSYDMISGKVDIFTPGVYTVSLIYRGIYQEATVVVLDDAMIGVYHTKLTTIGSSSSEDSDGYVDEGVSSKVLSDFIISADGTITMQGRVYPILSAIDEHTFVFKYLSYSHTAYYDNGILILDPENNIRLGYHNDKRPAVYFHERDWTVEKRFIVNYGSTYVLDASGTVQYSIDLLYVTSNHDQSAMWYGQKVHLASKTAMDTVYVNTWGVATVSDNFATAVAGDVASVTLEGEEYIFTLNSKKDGKVNKKDEVNKVWAGRTFTGTIDGKPAQIQVNIYGQYTIWIDGVKVLATDMQSTYRMVYGGVNEAESTLLLYDYVDDEYQPYGYKFIINAANNTFTYVERDHLFGFYEWGNMYIFLNGYGNGVINFDRKSYSVTQLSYELIGQELHITYLNTLSTFTYGTSAVLYTHTLGNLLITKSFGDVCEVGTTWRNSVIVDGAIVDISSLQIGAHANAKVDFYDFITITTKDGVMTNEQKKACLVTNAIKWTAPGFYRFSVNITVGGQVVTSYYTVQVLAPLAETAPVAQIFGQGILYQNSHFTLDVYGRMNLTIGGVLYSGLASFGEGNESFVGRVYSEEGIMVSVSGTMLHTGVLKLVASGGANFTELYTTGTSTVAGADGVVLRAYTVGGTTIYRLASSLFGVGDEATVTCLTTTNPFVVGAILKIDTADKTVYVRVDSWDNNTKGLTVSDKWRGTYTAEGKDDLTLDGFGKITLGSAIGSYRQNGKWIVATFPDLHGFILDTETMTYREDALPFGADSFVGKTYTATYNFACGDTVHSATTTFTFLADGEVTVTSTAPSHDSDCTDIYTPVFTTTDTRKATYVVSADTVIVSVGGVSFTFYVEDLMTLLELKLQATTLSADAHGYFSVGTLLPLN